MATVHTIFASASGNVEFVVDTIKAAWEEQGHYVEMHRAEVTSKEVIEHNNLFLLATSTWDHGEMSTYFKPLYEEMESMDLSGKYAFFVGCGDFRYEPVRFNTGIQDIHDRWLEQGGTKLHHPLKINGAPMLSVDNVINPWIEESFQEFEAIST